MHHWKHSHVGGVQRSTLQTSNSNCLYSLGYCLDIYSKMYIFFHNVHVYFNMNKGLWITFFFNRCYKNSHLAFSWIPNPASRGSLLPEPSLFCETVTPSSINGPLLGIGPTSGSTSDAPLMIQDSSWEVFSISLHPDLSASLQVSAQAASWLPLGHLFCHNNSALHVFFQKSWSQRQLKELSIRSNLHLVWLWPETIFLLLRITITTGTFRSLHAWQAFSSVILWQLCKYYHYLHFQIRHQGRNQSCYLGL